MIGYRMSRGPNLKEMARERFKRELHPVQPKTPVFGVLHRDTNGDEYWSDYGCNVIVRKLAGSREWIAGPWKDAPQGYDIPKTAEQIDISYICPY
jgi:hypothetical protein